MSDQGFERSVLEKLRALPGTFVYHPPDTPNARAWKPGDVIYGRGARWGVIECKEVAASPFPLSKWSSQQRRFAHEVTQAGGDYWLVVRYMPVAVVAAHRVTGDLLATGRGSLAHADGLNLTTSGRSFDIERLFGAV